MASKKNAEEIFNMAVELSDAAERAAFLDEACAGDEKVRAQVDALLKWHVEAGSFLEVPAVDPNATLETSAVAEGAGTVIGRYKLLEKVGEGGMATVYMAEQKHPIRRRVALKIIKLGMDTKQVIGRFEAERQALAMMDHPNIAKVFDAGTTETGRPYFVMELVRGVPITEFCDSNHLNTQERLELFITVCQAVQHAHQRGIIHRDIKPSNILVTLHDGEPVPKVIDFGIAKAVNQQLTEKTVFTRYSQMIGTPEYMSPEQAEMSGLDIDTRTDVFSLGVLLYELLTGTTPFDSEYLLSKGYSEMQRIIREEEPTRPSTKVSTLGEALRDVARHRKTSPELLCRMIRTDLDWIVMKTLEKDRSRRYESVSELAADIQRHLENEPVLAGRPSTVYRVQKFVKRNRLLVMSASVIAAVLVLATTVSLWQMVRANRAATQEKLISTQLEKEKDRAVRAEGLANQQRDRAEASEEETRLNLYAADMIAAQKYLRDGNLGATHTLLQAYADSGQKDDIRGWEWRYLWQEAQGDHKTVFRGHHDAVTSVVFSPDGELLASGGIDQSVIVRDRNGKEQVRFTTEGIVNSLSFSPNSDYLVVGHAKGASIWDMNSFTLLQTIQDHTDEGVFAVFAPSGSTLAIGYGSGVIRIVGFETGQPDSWLGKAHSDYPKEDYRMSPPGDGCYLSFSNDGSLIVKRAAGNGLYEVWDVDTQKLIASLKTPRGGYLARFGSATFVPETKAVFVAQLYSPPLIWSYESDMTTVAIEGMVGHRIVQGIFTSDGKRLITAGFDHTVRIWERSVKSFRETACLWGHSSNVLSIALSPDGNWIVSGGQDRHVLLWDSHHRSVATNIERPDLAEYIPCFSPDGQLLAIPYGTWGSFRTKFYDLNTLTFLKTEIDGVPFVFTDQKDKLLMCQPVEDEDAVIMSEWDIVDSKALWKNRIQLPEAGITGFPAICNSRGLIAQAWDDGTVIFVDYASGTLRKQFKAHETCAETVALSRKGDLLLTSSSILDKANSDKPNRNIVVVWSCSDLSKIKPKYNIQGDFATVYSAAFNYPGDIVATGGMDGRILLYDAQTGEYQRELMGHKQMAYSLAFSMDAKTLASASLDGTVRLWHVSTGRELATFEAGPCALTMAWSPDGNTLAALTGSDPYAPDELRIWRVPSFEEIEKAEESIYGGQSKQQRTNDWRGAEVTDI